MKKIKLFNCLLALVAMLSLGGCSNNDTPADSGSKPTADFSFTNVGSVFTFTNLSKDGTTYRWDFGDLSFTSDAKDPIYKYGIGGQIVVSLTVTNAAGQEAFISKTITAPRIIIIDIKVDGKFKDWDDVKYASESTTGNGSIQKVKIWAGGPNVNVYLEGNKTMLMELVDMYINSDGNNQSGFLSWQWPAGSGADYLFEGPLLSDSWGGFYKHTDPSGGWGWSFLAGSEASLKSSGIVSVNATTNAIEFSIPKTQLGTLGNSIGFAFSEMTSGWAGVANYPEVSSTSAFVKIDL
jgi:hypothetical protein